MKFNENHSKGSVALFLISSKCVNFNRFFFLCNDALY